MKNRFSNWIFNSFSVTPEGLALYRVFVALFALAFLLPSPEIYQFLASLPPDFYNPPPGPMLLLNDFPPVSVFYIFHYGLILSLLLLLIGYKTMWVSIATGVFFLILKGLIYAIGKINHDLLIVVVPLVMACSGWGNAYSIDSLKISPGTSEKKAESWPLVLLALIIGFMMFTAGFPKILGGWLDIDTQATYGHYFKQFFVRDRQDLLAVYAIHFENKVLWELLDYATILFETGFLVAIFRPKSTRLFICFAIIFHFSTMILLNIAFLPNFLAYAAFLNWQDIEKTIREKWQFSEFTPLFFLISAFGILGMVITIGTWLEIPMLQSDLRVYEFYVLLAALPIALYYILSEVLIWIRK